MNSEALNTDPKFDAVMSLVEAARQQDISPDALRNFFHVSSRDELASILCGDREPTPDQRAAIDQAFVTNSICIDGRTIESKPSRPATWRHGDRQVSWSFGQFATTRDFQARRTTLDEFAALACRHENGPKDGTAFAPATFKDGQRANINALRADLLALDIDDGTPVDEVIEAIKRQGWAGIVYTSASHLTRTTLAKADHFDAWRSEHGDDAASYLRVLKGYRPAVADGATIGDQIERKERRVIKGEAQTVAVAYREIHHAPMPKCRVVLPLASPWTRAAYSDGKVAETVWAAAVANVADTLGLKVDRSCRDVARLFYFPRVADAEALANARSEIIDGELADPIPGITAEAARARLEAEREERAKANRARHKRSRGIGLNGSNSGWPGIRVPCPVTGQTITLEQWGARYASGFQLVEAARNGGTVDADGVVTAWPLRGTERGGLVHCDCPFGHEHSTDTPEGTALVNASDSRSKGCAIICLHDHCAGRDRLDFIAQAIELGWLAAEDLGNPDFILAEALDAVKAEQRTFEEHATNTQPGKAETVEEGDWPAPVDFLTRQSPPTFPLDLIPSGLAGIVTELSQSTRACMSSVGMSALTALAAAIPNSVKVRVYAGRDDWTENPRLWAVLIGGPSTGKSPAIAAAIRPLEEIDSVRWQAYEVAHRDWQRAQKEDPKTAGDEPVLKMTVSHDATTERLQDRQSGNPDGLLVCRDEMSGWFGAIDKYGGGKGSEYDRGYFLTCFNGRSLPVDRIKRQARISSTGLCFLGAMVPDNIPKFAGAVPTDGLLQRFIPVHLAQRRAEGRAADPDSLKAYKELFIRLIAEGNRVIEFDEAARDELRRHMALYDDMVKTFDGANTPLAGAVGKYDGLLIRLSGLFHLIEGAPGRIPARIVRSAADFIRRFVFPNHLLLFSSTIKGEGAEGATEAAGYILSHGMTRIVPSDLTRNVKHFRGAGREDINRAMSNLENYGWVRPETDDYLPKAWQVNPGVHTAFSDRAREEKQRRARITELLRDAA